MKENIMDYEIKKLISMFLIPILLIALVFGISFTKKIRASKQINFHNIQTLNDLHKLFPKNVEDIKIYSTFCKNLIQDKVKKIIQIPDEKRNFENTAQALDSVSLIVHPIISAINSIEYLNPDKDMRDTAQSEGLMINDFLVDYVASNVDLYKAFKNYSQNNALIENLTDVQKYFIYETLNEFKNSGLELPPKQLERIKILTKDINALSTQFQINIAAHVCKIPVTKDELEGISESFINSLSTNDEGKYILGCDYPTCFTIMDQCKVESTRKKMYLEFANRAYPQNINLLEQIISKKDEKAKLLGFNNYADLSLDDQMAKNSDTVEKFLSDLADKAKIKSKQEIEMFLKNLPESINLVNGKIKPWDFRYIKEVYRKKYLNLDDLKISEYFPMQNTIDKLFDIYQSFFNLKFEKIDTTGFWHQDVQLIKINNNKDNQFLGYLLLDLFPRDNKFNHAANATIVHSYKDKSGKVFPAVCIMIANFPQPKKDKPSLLTYKDVVTFFHEFGHGLHSMLGAAELISFSGTNVKKDFVEMPSQMLENWLKDKDILKNVSSHYKTKQPLPDDMINKIVEIDKLDSGDQVLRQCYYAFLSLNLFKNNDQGIQEVSKGLFEKYLNHLEWQPDDHTIASFGHLMGYGASYYGYLWTDVFASDLFEKIKEYGLLNPEIGQKYIKDILSKGGSQDPNILLNNFLGREPNQNAYLKKLGFE